MEDSEVLSQVCPACDRDIPLERWSAHGGHAAQDSYRIELVDGYTWSHRACIPSERYSLATRLALAILGLTPTDWALQALGYSGYKGAPKRRPVRCPTFGGPPR